MRAMALVVGLAWLAVPVQQVGAAGQGGPATVVAPGPALESSGLEPFCRGNGIALQSGGEMPGWLAGGGGLEGGRMVGVGTGVVGGAGWRQALVGCIVDALEDFASMTNTKVESMDEADTDPETGKRLGGRSLGRYSSGIAWGGAADEVWLKSVTNLYEQTAGPGGGEVVESSLEQAIRLRLPASILGRDTYQQTKQYRFEEKSDIALEQWEPRLELDDAKLAGLVQLLAGHRIAIPDAFLPEDGSYLACRATVDPKNPAMRQVEAGGSSSQTPGK